MAYLKPFLNYTANDFDKYHRNAFKNASEKTHTGFLQSLKRIEKIFESKIENLNLTFIKDPKDLFLKLIQSSYAENTNLTTFTHMLKLLKIIDAPLQDYNNFQSVLNYHSSKREDKNEALMSEKISFLPEHETLKNIIENKINSLSDPSFLEMKQLLIVAIMVLAPTLKISSYIRFKIPMNSNHANSNIIIEEDGYYRLITNDLNLRINNMKLNGLLKKWINEYNPSNFLFIGSESSMRGMNCKDFRVAVSSATKSLFDFELNNNELKHIYMKYLLSLDPDLKQTIILSNILGYKNTNKMDTLKLVLD